MLLHSECYEHFWDLSEATSILSDALIDSSPHDVGHGRHPATLLNIGDMFNQPAVIKNLAGLRLLPRNDIYLIQS